MGKLRPYDRRNLALSQGKTQRFCKTRNNSAAHKNVSPPSKGPRAQPYPIVGMGRPGQPQVGNTHLGVNQEHLASTAGSDAGSAGVGGQPVGQPHGWHFHRHPKQTLPGLARGGGRASHLLPPTHELPAAQLQASVLAPCYSENKVSAFELILRVSGFVLAKV